MSYKSIEEKFYQGRAKIYETRHMDTSSLNAQQKNNLSITNKLGKINYTEAEISKMIEGYKEKFGMLQNKSDVDVLIAKLQSYRTLLQKVFLNKIKTTKQQITSLKRNQQKLLSALQIIGKNYYINIQHHTK
ncbi:hypothetical protein CHH55_17205 [Niallia circulans]|uniref:hypothetical protein n=1 Tax=Niallia circulans TaxID=1397 RepID=UPI000BA5EA89|nr:hypothetical protein [Niallia circulans]PAD86625.1 hypothetical protein CHH55_17205 [Niallia circulans]